MKERILMLILLVASFSFANAQFQVGLKAGANMNKLSGKSFKEEFSYAYHAGAFVKIGLGKKFSLQPEVLFNQVTSDTSDKFNALYKGVANITKAKLNYLSIPILLNYKLAPMIDIQAGPQFGILMNQSKNLINNGKDAFKEGDLAMLAGLQLNLGSFKVYGRYSIGLNNINDLDNKDQWKNQAIQLGVGLRLL